MRKNVQTMRADSIYTTMVVKTLCSASFLHLRSTPFFENRRAQLATIYCIEAKYIFVAVSMVYES